MTTDAAFNKSYDATAEPKLREDLITGIDAIAAELGLDRRAARNLLDKRLLPAKKVGGAWFAKKSELNEHFSSFQGPAAARKFFAAAGEFVDFATSTHADRDQIQEDFRQGYRIGIELLLPSFVDPEGTGARCMVRLIDPKGTPIEPPLVITHGRARLAAPSPGLN